MVKEYMGKGTTMESAREALLGVTTKDGIKDIGKISYQVTLTCPTGNFEGKPYDDYALAVASALEVGAIRTDDFAKNRSTYTIGVVALASAESPTQCTEQRPSGASPGHRIGRQLTDLF